MREFFFRQFGAGQPEKVKKREDFYLAGMPNANGEVFPPRCNMEDKLNALEKEREYLLEMCPKDKRDEYENGKETKLVRIILEKLPKNMTKLSRHAGISCAFAKPVRVERWI